MLILFVYVSFTIDVCLYLDEIVEAKRLSITLRTGNLRLFVDLCTILEKRLDNHEMEKNIFEDFLYIVTRIPLPMKQHEFHLN